MGRTREEELTSCSACKTNPRKVVTLCEACAAAQAVVPKPEWPKIVSVLDGVGGPVAGTAKLNEDGSYSITLSDSPAGRRIKGLFNEPPSVSFSSQGKKP